MNHKRLKRQRRQTKVGSCVQSLPADQCLVEEGLRILPPHHGHMMTRGMSWYLRRVFVDTALKASHMQINVAQLLGEREELRQRP